MYFSLTFIHISQIPTTPWDSVWNGVAEWMGIKGDTDLDYILPNRVNFDKCSKMFTAYDLFQNEVKSPCIDDGDGDGVEDKIDQCPDTKYWIDAPVDNAGCQVPTTIAPTTYVPPTVTPTWSPTRSGEVYEAELATYDEGSNPTNGNYGFTGSGYINMGDKDSWVEWPDVNVGPGGPCTLTFRYATVDDRNCELTINGVSKGTLQFATAGESWFFYTSETIETICPSGPLQIRVTAITGKGGPNLDNLIISAETAEPTKSPVTTGPTASSAPTNDSLPPTVYEAENENNIIVDGVIKNNNNGFTGTGYVDMGSKNAYVQFVEVNGGAGGSCILNFRYSVKAQASSDRDCMVAINGVDKGIAEFRETGPGWTDYDHILFESTCPSGIFSIRVTAATNNGGPNLDNVEVSVDVSPSTPAPTMGTPSPTVKVTDQPTSAPVTSAPTKGTPSPTVKVTDQPTSAPVTSAPTKGTPSPTVKVTDQPSVPTGDGTPVHSVLDPGSEITFVGTSNKAQSPSSAVDGRTKKMTLISAQSEEISPGFEAVPTSSQPSVVKAIRLYTSNISVKRDPRNYVLEGKNDGESDWTLISKGKVTKESRRNNSDAPIVSTFDAPDLTKAYFEKKFENDVAYTQYRVLFPGSGKKIFVGEVELPGILVGPAPTMSPSKVSIERL